MGCKAVAHCIGEGGSCKDTKWKAGSQSKGTSAPKKRSWCHQIKFSSVQMFFWLFNIPLISQWLIGGLGPGVLGFQFLKQLHPMGNIEIQATNPNHSHRIHGTIVYLTYIICHKNHPKMSVNIQSSHGSYDISWFLWWIQPLLVFRFPVEKLQLDQRQRVKQQPQCRHSKTRVFQQSYLGVDEILPCILKWIEIENIEYCGIFKLSTRLLYITWCIELYISDVQKL